MQTLFGGVKPGQVDNKMSLLISVLYTLQWASYAEGP